MAPVLIGVVQPFMLNLSSPFRILAIVTAIVLVTVNGVVWADDQPVVEVFTASDVSIITDRKVDRVELYEIDGIRRFEKEISRGLSEDANTAKRQAIDRVTQLDEGQKQQFQRSAIGLSKAMQYGIDRYPAVVFDGEVVVYGVTDLTEAIHRYRQWRETTAQ